MKPLTERDEEVLYSVISTARDWQRMKINRKMAPLDVGGFNGSHHSQTLAKLAKRGLVERIKFGTARDKGSCRYWTTPAGITYMRKRGKLPKGMK